jgi:hypothetical protein
LSLSSFSFADGKSDKQYVEAHKPILEKDCSAVGCLHKLFFYTGKLACKKPASTITTAEAGFL